MSYIYIGGDSYCAWRKNPERDWPLILANQLNLSIEGNGFAGQGWWPTRCHLLEYIKSNKFIDTEYFVFCHTDPIRALSTNSLSEFANKVWLTEIQCQAVSNWCASNWYLELNQLLAGRSVIHLRCFDSDLRGFLQLNGLKFTTKLLRLASESNNGNYDLMNKTPNHLSTEYNIKLANFLAQHLNNYSEKTLEISL